MKLNPYLVLLSIFGLVCIVCKEIKLKNICHDNDTSWNTDNVGSNIRRWLDTLDENDFKTPVDYHIEFKIVKLKNKDPQKRLHFILRRNHLTGKSISKSWKSFGAKGPKFHDGFLFGKLNSNFEFTGEDVAFIYPDFETALLGKFDNGVMIAAKPTKIIAERCQNGIKDLKFAKPKKRAPTLKYQRPNHLKPGDQPTICDPLERKNIYIGPGVKQDGVFARRDIRQGELICYLAGTVFNMKDNPIFFRNQTFNEKYASHRNLISLGTDEKGKPLHLNVPEGYWNTTQFRATLGHKINHSFVKARSAFDFATHPRYGLIRSVIAIEDIYKDEEIFVNYHYNLGTSIQWYKELYEFEVGTEAL